jgi:hypothetical protein
MEDLLETSSRTALIPSVDPSFYDSFVLASLLRFLIGIDPKWYVASNELTFFNSLKMKLSIVLGVSHMLLGIAMKAVNTIHFKNYVDLIFEFIPQMVFMLATFGYMVVCLFLKWSTHYVFKQPGLWEPAPPPSIIALFIDMVLKGGNAVSNFWQKCSDSICYDILKSNNKLFDIENNGDLQTTVQLTLISNLHKQFLELDSL